MADLPPLPSEEIRQLLVKFSGTPMEPRLRALSFLASKPEATQAETARYAGMSERSVRRLLVRVREGGIEAALYNGQSSRKLSPDSLLRLYEWVRHHPSKSLREVCTWVESHFNVLYTESGMRKLLNEAFDISRGFIIPDAGSTSGAAQSASGKSFDSDRLVHFLNLLPLTMDYGEWLTQVRGALMELFPQADIVHILLNPHVDLFVRRETSPRSAFISQSTATAGGEFGKPTMHMGDRKYTVLEDKIISILMEQHNRSIEEFHPPVIFNLHVHRDIHFTTITLLFSRHKANSGDQARADLEKLRPFLTFLFTDGAAREQLGHPERMTVRSAIEEIRERYGLSPREYQVLTLYLFSGSYGRIAKALSISPETVSSHVKSIRSKTGISDRADLLRMIGFPSVDLASL